MKRKLLLTFVLTVSCLMAGAQDASTLYQEGKALYEAEKYGAAFPKLKKAAEKGHKKAQYRLGRCYDKGRGVVEDNRQAFRWYAKSAAQGYAKGQYALGKCYLKGKGVEADSKKARTWLTRAVKNAKKGDDILAKIRQDAAQGDDDAQAVLRLISSAGKSASRK